MKITITIPESIHLTLASLDQARKVAVEAAAMGVEALLHDHFAALQSRPRRDDLAPTGFWSDTDGDSVAEQISAHILGEGSAAVIVDDKRLVHKLTGGTIRAADYDHPYLTIPATDAAARAPEGARSFHLQLAWVPHPDGGVRPALIPAITKRKDARSADVMYWLVRQVTHHPMPDALPDERAVADAAADAAADAIDSLLATIGDAA